MLTQAGDLFLLLLDRICLCGTLWDMQTLTENLKVRATPKLRKRIKAEAGRKDMKTAEFIRWCVNQVFDSIAWDKQIANDVKAGKMKKMYPRES